MLKNISGKKKAFAGLFLLIALFLSWQYYSHAWNLSPIVKEITQYHSEIGTSSNVEVSFIVGKYLQVGQGKDEVLEFLTESGFKIHLPQDGAEGKYVADYNVRSFLPIAFSMTKYRIILLFKHDVLTSTKSNAYTESL